MRISGTVDFDILDADTEKSVLAEFGLARERATGQYDQTHLEMKDGWYMRELLSVLAHAYDFRLVSTAGLDVGAGWIEVEAQSEKP